MSEIVHVAPSGMEILAELSRTVKDPQAAIEIAKQIVALQVETQNLQQARDRFEWEKYERDAKIAFAEAFAKFKESAPKILKTKHVNFERKDGGMTSYWQVELDKACDVLIPALLAVGITHRWKTTDLPGGLVRCTCYLKHRLGYEEEGASLAGPSDTSGGKNPIQGVGSSCSYLERYTFLATCGVVPKGMDNDGVTPAQVDANRMDENIVDEYCDAMRNAPDLPGLQAIFSECYKKAKALKDNDSLRQFQAVYDAAKKVI